MSVFSGSCLLNLACLSPLLLLAGCSQLSSGLTAYKRDIHLISNSSSAPENVADTTSIPKPEAISTPTSGKSDKVQNQNPTMKAGNSGSEPKPIKSPMHSEMKVEESGLLEPSIYYYPIYDEDKFSCESGIRNFLRGTKGENLISVCATSWTGCNLQGTCAIIQQGIKREFNVTDQSLGENLFFELTNTECKFGVGVRNYCLDPFYTIAADLRIYRPGDVIYIPSITGLMLPDGSVHDGFFIIRDQGRDLVGTGRFDFYTGLLSWNHKENPFRKIGLDDVKTRIPYKRISGPRAIQTLKKRSFPKFPNS